jgi:hypothetical protein
MKRHDETVVAELRTSRRGRVAVAQVVSGTPPALERRGNWKPCSALAKTACSIVAPGVTHGGLGMIACSEFQTKVLRRNLVSDEYKLYSAALEWDLTDPIVIEARKDLKSEKRWVEHLQPYHHQVTNLITFCRRLPVTLLADDVWPGQNN